MSLFPMKLISDNGVEVDVNEAAGVVSLNVSLNKSLGGGQAAGVMGLSGTLALSLSAKQLVDLGAALAEKAAPALAPEIAVADSAVDAELAKL